MLEKLITVRGNVKSDGSVTDGHGFRVVHDKTGLYEVLFDSGTFNHRPTITATPISNSAQDDKTRINVVIQRDGLQPDRFTAITGDDDGDLSSHGFGFIAVGPMPD